MKPQNDGDNNKAIVVIKDQVSHIQKKSRIESELVKNLKQLLYASYEMVSPVARFDISIEAALHNYHLIKKHGFKLDKIIKIVLISYDMHWILFSFCDLF